MRVAERLSQREASWHELEALLSQLSGRRLRRPSPGTVLRLGQLYRGVCGDLMLAESYHLPRDTVAYLHGLVGRAHGTLYQARGFRFRDLGTILFRDAPRKLRSDGALKLSAVVFVTAFLLAGLAAAGQPEFARMVVGEQMLDQAEQMYAQPLDSPRDDGLARDDAIMAGFYISHNTSIGLQCFAWGVFFGIGSLVQLLSNGIILGTIFGHMATSTSAKNFYEFVTAHSSFELTALVLAGAAGLRMGWGLIETKGQSRIGSLKREARNALPALCASAVLFVAAAFVEGFVSASSLPYWAKAAVAILSALLIMAYILLLGHGDTAEDGVSPDQPWADLDDAAPSRTAIASK